MKTKSILWLCLGLLLLAVPVVQTSAFDDEVEIELFEVSGFLPGDNPLDDPIHGGGGSTPPQPNDFRATIAGRTLAITSGVHSAQVIVRDGSGSAVLNTQFVGSTVEQLSNSGAYSLEIHSGSLTLVGAFVAQ